MLTRRPVRLIGLSLATALLSFGLLASAGPAAAHGVIQYTHGDQIFCHPNGTAVRNSYPQVQDLGGWVWHRSAIWSYGRSGWVTWNDNGSNVYWSPWSYAYGAGTTSTNNWTNVPSGANGTSQTFVGIPFVNYYDTYAVHNEIWWADGHVTAYWSNWSNWC